MAPGFTLQHDVPLAPLTTLEVGGPAHAFATVSNRAELAAALAWGRAQALPIFVLGGGSNVLVADAGFAGLVIQPAFRDPLHCVPTGDRQHVVVTAAAGLLWDDFVATQVDAGNAGLECLSGIPGWVGAVPVQNVGAYGQEIASTLVSVETVDRRDGTTQLFAHDACGFGYRTSHFKTAWRDRYIITAVTFRLAVNGTPQVAYAELQARLHAAGEFTLARVRDTVLMIRRGKSMVHDRRDANHRSAGSFFTNPIVPMAVAARLRAQMGDSMPLFPAGPTQQKLSAAWLIERSGFARGLIDGAVGLSTQHTLALINRGDACAADIVRLARRVRAGVHAQFGVTLQAEPVLLGFAADFDL